MNQNRPLLAAVWMTGSIFAFTAMAVAGRYVMVELDTFEVMTYRSLLGIAMVVLVAAASGTLRQVNTQNFGLHILRNIFHFTGQNLWFFAVSLIPLAQLVALEFTTPLWVILFAPFLLAERIGLARGISVLVGFAGILIVARPDFAALNAGLIAGAGCAVGFAGAFIFTKILTRTASITCILFYLVTTQAVMGIVMAGYDGDIAWPSAAIWPWVTAIGVTGLVAHFSITKALTLAPATIVGPLDFARLPFIALVGYLLFAEPVDIYVVLGALLILGANYLTIRSEPGRTRNPADTV